MQWEIERSQLRIDEPHFRVRQDDVRLPSGDVLDGYWVWESSDIVTIVPLTNDGQFILVRQWRHAAGRVMTQFPAGAVDADETPLEAAARELLEETGYAAGSYEHLGDIAVHPTKATGWHHLYLARNSHKISDPVADPTEETELVLVDKDELLTMLLRNEVQVADSVAAGMLTLQHLSE